MSLSGRHLYETAFDSRSRPGPDPPEGPDDLLETTLRLCGPAPPGRGSKRSPGCAGQRPKKLPSPPRAEGNINDVQSWSAEAKSPSGTNKDDHFSPSVEFKKLDFGGDQNNSAPEVPPAAGGEVGQEEPSAPAQIPRQPFDNGVSRSNLWLDFSRAAKRPRRHLALGIDTEGDHSAAVKPVAHLLKQGWYHGTISRADAENLLRLLKKGSFLVRCSEKLKRHYLLSLKSTRGVVHVKIVQLPNEKYVIRQQSQSFESIPQLIQYFSSHVLNIHEMNVYLSHPVIEKLL